MQCGYGHYVRLMQRLDTVIDVFLGLEPHFQEVIADITQRMGEGMAEFIQRDVSGNDKITCEITQFAISL
jgi:farnesyl-diphosphate farnesyltransferase